VTVFCLLGFYGVLFKLENTIGKDIYRLMVYLWGI